MHFNFFNIYKKIDRLNIGFILHKLIMYVLYDYKYSYYNNAIISIIDYKYIYI